MKDLLGSDVELYAIAYSAGSNHLIKHLGGHKGCNENCGFKAAVSISGVFDVLTAGIQLKYQAFGIYDAFLTIELAKHYKKNRYLFQEDTS